MSREIIKNHWYRYYKTGNAYKVIDVRKNGYFPLHDKTTINMVFDRVTKKEVPVLACSRIAPFDMAVIYCKGDDYFSRTVNSFNEILDIDGVPVERFSPITDDYLFDWTHIIDVK